MHFKKNNFAQGTIEYLVIMAVVVVLGLVVVGLFTGIFSNTSQQVTTSSDGFSVISGGISIVESVVDPNGDSLVFLSNNSSDAITLTKISAGGVDNNYNSVLVGLDSKGFSLSGISSSCPCVSGQKSVKCEFKIEYLTLSGITKTEYRTVSVQCVNDSTAVDDDKIIDPIVDEVVVFEDGSLENPWIVNNCLELQDMNLDLDANYKLGNNIDCYTETRSGGALYNNGNGFRSIGNNVTPFRGSLDGDGKTISNLNISSLGITYVGLFGYLDGNVSNVGLIDINVNVINSWYVGGLVGRQNSGTIFNSYVTGDITGSSGNPNEGSSYIGGLAGQSLGNISYSNSTADVTGDLSNIGGLVGESFGAISNSYSTGNVTGSTDDSYYVGGLVGKFNGTALNYATINNSYSIGNVLGAAYIGGLVGSQRLGDINNSYARGNVTDSTNIVGNVGGLVGRVDGAMWLDEQTFELKNGRAVVFNSYSTGDVEGAVLVGGLIGRNESGTITTSYYDTNTSGQIDSGKGVGKTTNEMKNMITYNGWDFIDIWNIGGSYPFLRVVN